ncbi:hypothetical protein KQX54_010372 [Cotesia glomerata]|uniref:Uncharacterized protein n=1 Tax=Cotesia glomerata TaxID=32391 RepID=A0AAV7ITR5_COTGL|nr:hypothetical protein KQX54_010372 [Cotesia glomerata]
MVQEYGDANYGLWRKKRRRSCRKIGKRESGFLKTKMEMKGSTLAFCCSLHFEVGEEMSGVHTRIDYSKLRDFS